MASFSKINAFVENLAEGIHDADTHTFTVALTNSAPVATNTVLANITEVAYTYCSSRALVLNTSAQSSGTYSLVFNDLVLTASGGAVGPFRYVVIYNDTATNDPLVGWYDYGSSITLADGETLTIDFGASGLFTLA